jgi:C4-type Zn-finger protein
MQKREFFAVHKRKLEEFLKKLELWEPLTRGELKCAICGTKISLDNIGLIIPSGQEILICCCNAECMFKIKELWGESKDEP